jgi:hypothetical protein
MSVMEALEAATILLKTHGGEFLSVVLAGVVVKLALYIRDLHASQREDDKAQITILEGLKAAVEALTKTVDRLANKRG